MKKIFTLLLALTIITQWSFAQGRKVYEKAAAEALNAKDYSTALAYYEVLLDEAEYEDINNYYNAAQAAYNFRLFNRSERYFQWVIDKGGRDQFSTIDYEMALTKKRLGKYAEAKALFEKYATEHPSSTSGYVEKANKEIADCEWAIDQVAHPVINVNSLLPVTNLDIVEHLDTTVNSSDPDLAPLSRNGMLYYSSLRHFNGEDKDPQAKILASTDGKLAEPVAALEVAKQSISHTSFNAAGSRVYFTVCDTAGLMGYHCDIYFRDRAGDGWGEMVALESINKKEATSTHPAVGFDGKTGEELLFFASNREGGKGGMDIWCSFIGADGQAGSPYNVGALNTEGDDITPYFHNKNNTLYFSTDGRKSLGGFDIYKSKKNGETWASAEHTGYPLNSSYDDLYPSLDEKGSKAYLVSNRPGGICKDTSAMECVCDDIYAVDVPYIDLIVETYNKLTGDTLHLTTVSLIPTGSSPEVQGPTADFSYSYGLNFDQNYQVLGTKPLYIQDDTTFNTFNITESGTILKKLYLTPLVNVFAHTFDKKNGDKIFGAKVELVAAPTVSLLESKQEAGMHGYEYGLNFFKRYLLIASKEGYTSDTVAVFTDNIAVVPTTLREDLFLCKLPFDPNPKIVLYFDNDIPKMIPGIPEQTLTDYKSTYLNYTSESKKREYLNAFTSEDEKSRVRNFFADVESNYNRLESFADNLYNYLSTVEQRDTVVVTIKGYASPLAKPAYNKLLTARRIYSLEKYLSEYKGGILKPYLTQIRIEREPYGEDTAKGGSEDRTNKKASIYSPDASVERRVEIINITTSKFECPENNPTINSGN